MELQKDRFTVRKYTDKEITDDLLNELLEIACRASNTGNMQTYSVIVTRSTEGKSKLSPAHFNQPMVKNAPVVLTFCADFNRFIHWCKQRNATPGYANLQSFIGAAIDATIVAQQFATAAEAVGLGICYLGTTTYNAQPIIEALQLPPMVMPITTLTVGYPIGGEASCERLPLAAVVHNEQYINPTAEEIDLYYAHKEELNHRFVVENGKETLAQVFTDVRYPRANNEHFSHVFSEVLKQQWLSLPD